MEIGDRGDKGVGGDAEIGADTVTEARSSSSSIGLSSMTRGVLAWEMVRSSSSSVFVAKDSKNREKNPLGLLLVFERVSE